MNNIFLEKIAETQQPKTGSNTLLHTLGTEGTALATGLGLKAVGSRFGGGKIGEKISNSRLGRAAAKYIWNSPKVPGGVLTGEVGEYVGSFGGVYGALKAKEYLDEKRRSDNAVLQKAASLILSR